MRRFIDIFGCPSSFAFYGAFVWREGHDPPFKKLTELATPEDGAVRAVGVSADGRTILDDSGGLYIDDMGPFDLREILAQAGVADLPDPSDFFFATAISESGLVIVGYTFEDNGGFGGPRKAWRVRLSDCDGNSVADELERIVFSEDASRLIAEGSRRFLDSRDTLGYGDMISHYGLPWQPGQDRVPQANLDQPAESLRALLRLEGCLDGDAVSTEDAADRFLVGVAFPCDPGGSFLRDALGQRSPGGRHRPDDRARRHPAISSATASRSREPAGSRTCSTRSWRSCAAASCPALRPTGSGSP